MDIIYQAERYKFLLIMWETSKDLNVTYLDLDARLISKLQY